MKLLRLLTALFLVLFIESFTPAVGVAQDRLRIGVPLFPPVSFPILLQHSIILV
jgi:hypothetical protein